MVDPPRLCRRHRGRDPPHRRTRAGLKLGRRRLERDAGALSRGHPPSRSLLTGPGPRRRSATTRTERLTGGLQTALHHGPAPPCRRIAVPGPGACVPIGGRSTACAEQPPGPNVARPDGRDESPPPSARFAGRSGGAAPPSSPAGSRKHLPHLRPSSASRPSLADPGPHRPVRLRSHSEAARAKRAAPSRHVRAHRRVGGARHGASLGPSAGASSDPTAAARSRHEEPIVFRARRRVETRACPVPPPFAARPSLSFRCRDGRC